MNKNILCIVVCVLAILLMTVLDSRGQIGITGNAAFVGAAGFSAASGGGGGGGSPAFASEFASGYQADGLTQYQFACSGSISAGSDVIVLFHQGDGVDDPTSVSDSGGNTYTLVTNLTPAASYNFRWYRSTLSSSLSAASYFHVNYAAGNYRRISIKVITCTGLGAPQPDTTATEDYYGLTPTVAFDPTATATIAICGMRDASDTRTYTPGSGWAEIGSVISHQSTSLHWLIKTLSSGSATSVGGTFGSPSSGVESAVITLK